MTDLNAPPGALDLAAFLATGDFIKIDPSADLQTPCAASLEMFEGRTGFEPFLFTGEPTEREFDAPGPQQPRGGALGGFLSNRVGGGHLLNLRGGIVGKPVSVIVDGQVFTEGDDFVCLPANAPARGKPYTLIEFTRSVWSERLGVKIVAPWGYCRPQPEGKGFPPVAWQGILQGAAATIFYTLPNNPDTQSISRGVLSESFEIASTMTPNQRGEGLLKVFNDAIKKYRRVGEI